MNNRNCIDYLLYPNRTSDKEKLYKIEKYCRDNGEMGLVDIDGIMDIISEVTYD